MAGAAMTAAVQVGVRARVVVVVLGEAAAHVAFPMAGAALEVRRRRPVLARRRRTTIPVPRRTAVLPLLRRPILALLRSVISLVGRWPALALVGLGERRGSCDEVQRDGDN